MTKSNDVDAGTGCADDQSDITIALASVPASEADRIVRHALEIMRLRSALLRIAAFPIPEQDNMISASMRFVAAEALKEKGKP